MKREDLHVLFPHKELVVRIEFQNQLLKWKKPW